MTKLSEPVEHELTGLDEKVQRLLECFEWVVMIGEEDRLPPVFPMDVLAFAVLNRAHSQLQGFVTLVRAGNYLTAASLVRLYLDNALRFSASTLVNDRQQFAKDVIVGEAIRNLKDRHNQRMTDAYLVGKMAAITPWVKGVYDATCELVHLSDKHIQHTMIGNDRLDRATIRVGGVDDVISDADRIEGIQAMNAITILIMEGVEEWGAEKRRLLNEYRVADAAALVDE